ncbi:MAG: 4-(cytidine 5'-diphospho)-2-C-methyl-D-erythritol kinase [Ignavibacteriales bacterium]|nr:4-(cytidine 5'-diphospho)-2-C-methyl-D-erythritol kinase [Ignavibacteriales bacterium]
MISVKAYAKINLGLRIFDRRIDGYHNLETVFVRVNPFDEIILEEDNGISFSSNELNLNSDPSNLCIKAAKLFNEHYNLNNGVKIKLQKNIPIGAGMGGGSSDAAATLLGLIKLWDLKITEAELKSITLKLGSDVPYFLKPGMAHATGRGEILEYFSLPLPYWIVILYPDIHVSTSWAYQSLNAEHSHHISHPTSHITLKDFLLKNIHNSHELNHNLVNDFEPVVLHQHKQIGFAKLMLYSEGASFAQMSGSGSAVYGFFLEEQKAVRAAERLKTKYKVFITPPNFDPE